MTQEKATKYAEALEKNMGRKWRKFRAIASHKYQTWAVLKITDAFEDGNEIQTLFTSEEQLIHFLIGYAGKE